VFYSFDPRRNAVLLLGGSKVGLSDRRFYAEMVPIAERILCEYLEETKDGYEDDPAGEND
jgi:hypothetical protein